jgi:hypothetical protein
MCIEILECFCFVFVDKWIFEYKRTKFPVIYYYIRHYFTNLQMLRTLILICLVQDNSGERVCQSSLVVTKPDVEHYTCPYTDIR